MADHIAWLARARDVAPDIHHHLLWTLAAVLAAKASADGLLAVAEALDEAGWYCTLGGPAPIGRQYGALSELVRGQVPVRDAAGQTGGQTEAKNGQTAQSEDA